MSSPQAIDRFKEVRVRLNELYDQVRRPAYRRLRAHADIEGRPLPVSTTGALLNGLGVPRWDTVEAFVAACHRHARTHRPPLDLPAAAFDLSRWAAWYHAAVSSRDRPSASRKGRGSQIRAGASAAVGGPVVPHELPTHTPHFVGRAEQLRELTALLDAMTNDVGAVVICVISGTAGVGKTSLAVHWAHHVADRFPDGQLYVNLRGFGPDGSVVDPADAVRGFLDTLGISPRQVPVGLAAQTALYRSLLSQRRMLIVLDNARDTSQVRPLLPGSCTSLVLVTGRHQLTGLVAYEGARPVTLDLLTVNEARDLLARRIGADRVAAEPEAVDEIIARCARLPLALAVMAAQAVTRPEIDLRVLAEELQGSRSLDALTGDDPASDVRSVFSWSYRALSPDAARLFRLFGRYPGPDISSPAAASLAGLPTPMMPPLLTELSRAHLIDERAPGRYGLHDLLRAYATDLGHTVDSTDELGAATRRILDHYLHTAYSASLSITPGRDPIAVAPPEPGTSPEDIAGSQHAMDWFTAERAVLLAAVDHAASTGHDSRSWQLAWSMTNYLDRRGLWHEWAAAQRTALTATQRLADPIAESLTERNLARAYIWLGRHEDAHGHLRHALDTARRAGDSLEQAHTHLSLAAADGRRGRHTEALAHAQQALDLYVNAGHRKGQALAFTQVGWYHATTGNYHEALHYCRQALALNEEFGHRAGQAATWDSIGYIHHHLQDNNQAAIAYQHAIDLFQELGDSYGQAEVLVRLGDTHHATRNLGKARHAWRRALDILTDLDHPDAEQVRAKLAQDT